MSLNSPKIVLRFLRPVAFQIVLLFVRETQHFWLKIIITILESIQLIDLIVLATLLSDTQFVIPLPHTIYFYINLLFTVRVISVFFEFFKQTKDKMKQFRKYYQLYAISSVHMLLFIHIVRVKLSPQFN